MPYTWHSKRDGTKRNSLSSNWSIFKCDRTGPEPEPVRSFETLNCCVVGGCSLDSCGCCCVDHNKQWNGRKANEIQRKWARNGRLVLHKTQYAFLLSLSLQNETETRRLILDRVVIFCYDFIFVHFFPRTEKRKRTFVIAQFYNRFFGGKKMAGEW